MMFKLPSLITGEEDDLTFDALKDDDARFEYAQYIVNTAPKDRPEISESDAKDALDWMAAQSTES